MTHRDNVLVRHRDEIREIAARRKAKSIALVGSVARGENSDYGFLVEFTHPTGLFNMSGLRLDLEDLLGEKVDVVTTKGIKDHCRSMFDDAILLWMPVAI